MRLFSLLREAGIAPATADTEITYITDALQNVRPGALFVCTRTGAAAAGVIPQALMSGAAAAVCEETYPDERVYCSDNARLAFSRMCAAFYRHPHRKMKLIGVTGTNGKTTTVQYLRFLLEQTGHKCAVIGTLGADTGEGPRQTGYTTPGADVFFSALAEAADHGNEYCVCEVSSQALAQYRVDGARFSLGIFTNVGTDHLDYHKTLRRLVEAKCRLCMLSDTMLLNADDAYCDAFLQASGDKKAYLYSCRAVLSDFAAKNAVCTPEGVRYILFNGSELQHVEVPGVGMFAVYNSLCASAAAMLLGAPLAEIAPLLKKLPQIPGRAEWIEKDGVRFCVDYAHTPDALGGMLGALRENTAGKLICVFGCGGDRDRTKRAAMGEIAAQLSDTVIVTSDNPRTEDPIGIINDIRAKIRRVPRVFTEPDRRRAIALAYEKASPGDVILVAGKGHETYQLIGGKTIPFSDRDVIAALPGR